MADMRREYKKVKQNKDEEIWECERWKSFKTDNKIINHVKTNFPYKKPIFTDSLLGKIKD